MGFSDFTDVWMRSPLESKESMQVSKKTQQFVIKLTDLVLKRHRGYIDTYSQADKDFLVLCYI